MREQRQRLGPSRVTLVALGIALGYVARLTFGGPAEEPSPLNSFENEVLELDPNEDIDLPLIGRERIEDAEDQSGLVPPVYISRFADSSSIGMWSTEHDSQATFEPHGEQECASGCAMSRHPTEELTQRQYLDLTARLNDSALDENNSAFEELLYFGPQTKQMMLDHGIGNLSQETADFLWDQLQFTHARVSLRVVDQEGQIRTWVDGTRVPLDRRHVFKMKTENLQPLVTSGTVKRVGLYHLWTRM